MNPALLALIPGALIGLGFAVALLSRAPRVIHAGDALQRLGDVTPSTTAAASDAAAADRIGSWLHRHVPNLPGFTPPLKQLELIEMPVSQFYAAKLQSAVLAGIGFPLLSIVLQIMTGAFAPFPLLMTPLAAFVGWVLPDSRVAAQARASQREFTRFVTVYLELVAVALLGNSTADGALSAAASVSDSWVFRRIRREYQIAEITRVSKWDALERLGESVGVVPLVEMARMMRLSDARIALRDQLRAACAKLRAQVASDDKEAAERRTSQISYPVMMTLLPVLAITITPAILQLISQ